LCKQGGVVDAQSGAEVEDIDRSSDDFAKLVAKVDAAVKLTQAHRLNIFKAFADVNERSQEFSEISDR
jgi:hypothetical protein